MTAVTTAGLLAGLFGSAFVPAAKAVDVANVLPVTDVGAATGAAGFRTTSAASPGYDGTATDGAGVKQYYAVASKVIQFEYVYGTTAEAAAEIPASSGTVTFTLTAGTIKSITGTAAYTNVAIAPDLKSVTMLSDASATAAELAAVKVNVTAPASGTMKMTIAFTDSAAAAFSSSITMTIVPAAKMGTVTSVGGGGYSTMTVSGITQNATTLAWSDDHGVTDGVATLTAKNEYNVEVSSPTAKLLQVTSSDPAKVVVNVTPGNGTPAYGNAAGSSASALHTDATAKIGVYPEEGASGTVTLTFTINGTVVATRTYTVLGPIASLTPTRTIQYIAEGGALTSGTSTSNAFTLVAKDAAGTQVAYTGANLTWKVDGAASNKVSSTNLTTALPGYGQFTSGLCASGDAGTTKSIEATGSWTDSLGTTTSVSSASWTITCTGASGIITNIAFDKAAYLPSSVVYIKATATDSAGRPLGYGAGKIESGTDKSGANGANAATTDEFSIVKQGTITLNDVDTTNADTNQGIIFDGWVNGTAEWGALSHSAVGDFGLVLTIADNDPVTAGSQEKAFSPVATVSNILSSVVDGTLVAGPKKLKATATFGASAANKKIAFTLENTRTGVVKTYYRKANALGVASFTLRFGGTYEVTAAYGDYMTDTVTLSK